MPCHRVSSRGRKPIASLKGTVPGAIIFLCLFWSGEPVALAQAPGKYKGIEENLPIKVAPQPIAFSHRQHAGVGVACGECHEHATEGERAGLPNLEGCMVCHRFIQGKSPAIQQLVRFAQAGKNPTWVRVYQVPDFVFFSHASHVNADVACATCHGPVSEQDVLAKEISTSMTTCMDCHLEQEVSNSCYLCHSLGQ